MIFETGSHLFSTFLDASVKGALLLLATGILVYTLRRASASLRHWIWCLAFCGLVLLPVLSALLPAWSLPILPAGDSPPAARVMREEPIVRAETPGKEAPAMDRVQVSMLVDRHDTRPAEGETRDTSAPVAAPLSMEALLPVLWCVGFLVSILPLLLGILAAHLMVRKLSPIEKGGLFDVVSQLSRQLGLKRKVAVFLSDRAVMPMAFGFLRPRVLLPRAFMDWPRERQQMVLLHELAHLRRRDCPWQALASIAAAVHWFNPLAWLALHRLRIERERACDDVVLNAGSEAPSYAGTLLEMVQSLRAAVPASAAAVTMARRSEFEGRLLAILEKGRDRCGVSSRARGYGVLAATILLLPLAMVRCTTDKTVQESSQSAVAREETPPLEESAALAQAMAREDWPQYYGYPDHNNYRKVDDEIRYPKILWRADFAPVPAVKGNDVFAGGYSLRRLDLRTGEVKASWRPEELDEQINFQATPIVLEDRVITHAGNGKVYALKRDLSGVIWSSEAKGVGFFGGVCAGDLFIISAGTRLLAFDVSDGSVRWSKRFSRLARVEMTPAVADGKLLYGSWNGNFYALDLEGNEVWVSEGERNFGWTDPVAAFGKVFVGDRGGVINAFDLETGERLWETRSGMTGLSTPGVIPGRIVVGFGRVVMTYDEKTGEPVQDKGGFPTGANPFGSPTLVGNTLYFGNLDGHLYAFDYATEKMKWALETAEGKQVHGFVYHRNILLVRTMEGLYAIGNDPDKGEAPEDFVLFSEEYQDETPH